MNRRSFLSTLAAIPGLGWVNQGIVADEIVPPVSLNNRDATHAPVMICERARIFRLMTDVWGRDARGSVHFGMGTDGPAFCSCLECAQIMHEDELTRDFVQAAITASQR